MKLYSSISLIFLIWLISILFISFLGFVKLPHSDYFSGDFFQSFSNWDGRHYIGIAQFGYINNTEYAFFPLYPLLIRLVSQITHDYLLSALLISFFSTFFGLHLLYKLISLDFDKKIAEKTVTFLLFFSTSFYLLAAYSEGLFFLLVVSTFYSLRTNRIFWAVIFASLVSAVRLPGLAVVVALILHVQLTSGINKKNWFLLFSPLGFFAYCLFLYNQTGDLLYFLEAEKNWQREISIPLFSFWDTVKNLMTPSFINANFISVLDLLFSIFGLGLTIRSFRFLPTVYSVYAAASMLIPLVTPTLSSMPRFLLPIFPLFVLIALTKNKYLILGYQMISLMILAVLTILFINGYWVA